MMKENEQIKENKSSGAVKVSKMKPILVQYGLLQFFGLLFLAIAVIIVGIIFTNNNAQAAETPEPEIKTEIQYIDRVVEKPVETIVEKEVIVEKPVEVEVEKIVEKEVVVEKPVEVIKEVTIETIVEKPVEVEVEKVVEVEKEVIVEKPVEVEVIKEVEVEKVVEVEKEVKVVDQEATQALATEMAQQMFTILKDSYTAQVDTEATEKAVEEKYNELKETYIAQVDAEEVLRLATEMAKQMFEEYKVEYAETQETARINNISTISILVYGGKTNFYLQIQGSLYERLTYEMIYEALQADSRFEGYKVNRVANKYAVEVFIGEDYTSTREIRIELK